MTQAGSQSSIDEKANKLASLILGNDQNSLVSEKEAKAIVREDSLTARPLPVRNKKLGKANSDYNRAKALKILELRIEGLSFEEIARLLDYKSGRHVRAAYDRLMERHEKESVLSLRELQNERLEMAWRGLAPKVAQGRERAVEVAIKVLERQARLQGLDVPDEIGDKTTNQAIQINIMAHPDDAQAREMIIEHNPDG